MSPNLILHPFRLETVRQELKIALVGKYIKLHDAYSSVIKALEHAALAANYKISIQVTISIFSLCLIRGPSSFWH